MLFRSVDSKAPVVKIPKHATTSTDWDLSILARIVTDRTTQDGPFIDAMCRAWQADPETKFHQVSKNCYLIEFTQPEEMEKALFGGVWTFKGDLVALKKVSSNSNLSTTYIQAADIWVQFFGLPIQCLTDEGVQIMSKELGVPVSHHSEEETWVGLVTAKYLPRSNLWSSKREYQCSIFWKSIMRLRGRLAPLVSWNLGSGNTCHAIGQPWFPGGTDYSPENTQQRKDRKSVV